MNIDDRRPASQFGKFEMVIKWLSFLYFFCFERVKI